MFLDEIDGTDGTDEIDLLPLTYYFLLLSPCRPVGLSRYAHHNRDVIIRVHAT